jgi:pimeloyl-ACP methyl ester carboxylesterase
MSLASALLVAALMPRGPITTGQALILLGTGVILGVGAGLVMHSRWAMLVAPVTFIATLEVALRSGDSIVFDAPRFDMTYGVVAFMLGRGFIFLVGIVPMLLGVAYGAALARRIERGQGRERRRWDMTRRIMGAGATIGVIGLAVLIAWPASVPALLDADGNEIPTGQVELTAVPIGGHEQWISVRASNPDAPVVLWLSGGPGQSDMAFTRALFDPIAEDVVFVNWDQRGAGKSRPALDPASTWTLDQAVADTIELTNYLRDRFDEEKIYLVGESWGSTLGVLAVQQRPDLYHAYIGSGQMVSQRETDRIIYHDVLDYAVSTGDSDLQATLEDFGEPPYRDIWAYTFMMEQYEVVEPEYSPPAVYLERGNRAAIGPWGVLASEYTFVEKVNVLAGALEMFSVMYPQLQAVDFRVDVPKLDAPVYIMLGEAELEGRASLAREWFDLLQAPAKELLVIEDAGHSTALEGVETFHQLLVEEIIPATYPEA